MLGYVHHRVNKCMFPLLLVSLRTHIKPTINISSLCYLFYYILQYINQRRNKCFLCYMFCYDKYYTVKTYVIPLLDVLIRTHITQASNIYFLCHIFVSANITQSNNRCFLSYLVGYVHIKQLTHITYFMSLVTYLVTL